MISRMIFADADQSAPSALAVVLLVVAVAALTLLASQLRGWLHSRTAANGAATRVGRRFSDGELDLHSGENGRAQAEISHDGGELEGDP